MAVDGHLPGDLAGLQAITAATAGFIEAPALVRIIEDATRRVALVEVGGQAAGTGVLVGPDLLLTAAHVVRSAGADSVGAGVVAWFDFLADSGRAPFETGTRVPVVETLASSPPSDEEDAGSALVWEAPQSRLDFALLRLAGPPAASLSQTGAAQPRGHYVLREEHYDFGTPGIVFIVQHPLRMPQKISYTFGPMQINAMRTRVRYRNANTAAGSSGSPLIDAQGRLLGIHHYAVAGENQGVPASAIARAVRISAGSHLLPLPHSALPDQRPEAAEVTAAASKMPRRRPVAPVTVLSGHTGPVSTVSVTRMGSRQLAVSAGFDRSVRVWDLATGEKWARFTGHQDLVYTTGCADVEGEVVALSGGEGPYVRRWGLASRQELVPLMVEASAVNALCCTQAPAGMLVVVGTTEGDVQLWEAASGRKVAALHGHTAAVSAVACATVEGRPAAITGSRDGSLRLWDLTTGRPTGQLHGHTAAITAIACTTIEDRPTAITGSRDETLRLWDLTTLPGTDVRTAEDPRRRAG